MATVNLHKNYKQPLVQAFEYSSVLAGKSTTEYSWRGNEAIVLTDINTESLNDYNRGLSSNRYGTPTEVTDNQQILTLQKDRSFAKIVDKGNYQEQNYLKTGAAVIKAYMNEQVSPEMERFYFHEVAHNAGKILTTSAKPTASNILAEVLKLETALDEARAPKDGRYVAMPHEYVALIRQSLTNLDNVTDKWLIKGVVGKIGTMNVIGVASADMPQGAHLVAWQKKAVANPKTIEDAKVSKDVPGVSGILIEGRFRYGVFVVGKRSGAVVAMVDAAKKCTTPTITKGETTSTIAAGTGETIYYTVDGTDPRYSNSAKAYSAAITNLAAGGVIRAVAKADGKFASDLAEQIF